jgi:hypothetical protein
MLRMMTWTLWMMWHTSRHLLVELLLPWAYTCHLLSFLDGMSHTWHMTSSLRLYISLDRGGRWSYFDHYLTI